MARFSFDFYIYLYIYLMYFFILHIHASVFIHKLKCIIYYFYYVYLTSISSLNNWSIKDERYVFFFLSQNNLKFGWYMSFDDKIDLKYCWEKWIVETILKNAVWVEAVSSLLLFIKKEPIIIGKQKLKWLSFLWKIYTLYIKVS